MSLLAPTDAEKLRAELAAMVAPVRLLFFTQTLDCDACVPTRQILDELPALSGHVSIDEVNFILEKEKAERYGIDRVPAIVVLGREASGVERDSGIRFLGMPAGYEFVALIRAVLLVGGGTRPQLSEVSRQRLAAVNRPMTIRVFSTPTCPHCPRAVTLAHEMAWVNPNITSFAVEVTEYPDLARRYHVSGVPKTVVDDTIEILGALPEQDFVLQALAGLGDATAPATDSGEGSAGSS